MKRIFILILFTFFIKLSFSQSAESVYIVKFTDKGNDHYSVSRPSEFLSQKSIERRLVQQIPVNESDIPVSREYLNELKQSGAEILYSSKWLNLAIVKTSDKVSINRIQQKPFVKEVTVADKLFDKNASLNKKPLFQPDDINRHIAKQKTKALKSAQAFDYGLSFNQIHMIGIDQMHTLGYTGQGITIAVIDAGFNSADVLDAFDSLRVNGQILGTRDFVQPGNNVYNSAISTHGMMVLSTMGGNLPGQLIGTAPKASYWLLRSEDATAEYLMEEYYWVNAAEYADSVGADIINSSLGYTRFDNPAEDHTYADMDGNTTVVTIGADMAASKGILVVNSAGNSGSDSWHYIGAPADGDSVLTIGAVDAEGAYAGFSSVGPTSDGRIKPDVAAQGVNTIVAIVPSGVAGGSGTSFSSPVIAGASACLWQANPTYSNMELLNAIRLSGNQAAFPDNYLGWGIPDFFLANNLLTSMVLQGNDPFSELTMYPIPFKDRINIEISSTKGLTADIKLINSFGTVVAEMNGVALSKGKNLVVFNKLDRLGRGIYMLQISNGVYSIAGKVVN